VKLAKFGAAARLTLSFQERADSAKAERGEGGPLPWL
jgi:hypothetical protein